MAEKTPLKNVSQFIVDTLADAGIRNKYAIAGDSLNALTDAIIVSRLANIFAGSCGSSRAGDVTKGIMSALILAISMRAEINNWNGFHLYYQSTNISLIRNITKSGTEYLYLMPGFPHLGCLTI